MLKHVPDLVGGYLRVWEEVGFGARRLCVRDSDSRGIDKLRILKPCSSWVLGR